MNVGGDPPQGNRHTKGHQPLDPSRRSAVIDPWSKNGGCGKELGGKIEYANNKLNTLVSDHARPLTPVDTDLTETFNTGG